jgi:hypothetical protein
VMARTGLTSGSLALPGVRLVACRAAVA